MKNLQSKVVLTLMVGCILGTSCKKEKMEEAAINGNENQQEQLNLQPVVTIDMKGKGTLSIFEPSPGEVLIEGELNSILNANNLHSEDASILDIYQFYTGEEAPQKLVDVYQRAEVKKGEFTLLGTVEDVATDIPNVKTPKRDWSWSQFYSQFGPQPGYYSYVYTHPYLDHNEAEEEYGYEMKGIVACNDGPVTFRYQYRYNWNQSWTTSRLKTVYGGRYYWVRSYNSNKFRNMRVYNASYGDEYHFMVYGLGPR